MMNMKEFSAYVKENIKDYLPPSYANAHIRFQEVVKSDVKTYQGVSIVRPDEKISPLIYLDQLYKEYQMGRDIDEIVGDIADLQIKHEVTPEEKNNVNKLFDYNQVRDKLQIQMCDTKASKNRIKGLVTSERSDLYATYHVVLSIEGSTQNSIAVTPALLDLWGISKEQLHRDALNSELNRTPIFSDLFYMMNGVLLGTDIPNYLLGMDVKKPRFGAEIYCLTNIYDFHGANLIMQDELMTQIADILETNFFILPSSCHELMIVPDRGSVEIDELFSMVRDVNRMENTSEDWLSDEIQYYDKEAGIIENAHRRFAMLDKEKSGKSIRNRLNEAKKAKEVYPAANKGDRTKNREIVI